MDALPLAHAHAKAHERIEWIRSKNLPSLTRVVVPTDSQDAASWGMALAIANELCTNGQPKIERIVLLTHAKAQLDSTSLANHIGQKAAKMLSAGKELQVSSGAKLRHATLKTAGYSFGEAVVIAYFADDKLLEFIDGKSGVAAVVAVPDVPGVAEEWIARWNPIIFGQTKKPDDIVLIEDAVFENALKSISKLINLSHNALNPRDESHVKEYLRILRAKGHSADPTKVKSWAIKNGWKPGAAQELANMVKKIGEMKTKPSLSAIYNSEGKYERWKNG